MRNEEKRFFAGAVFGTKTANAAAENSPPHQSLKGIAGRLRPYRDVRAGFEPWRRAALQAWTSSEEAITVH